ncbi:helix-turn-helix transcriptional regulator [Candidatus Williamhamiltonella defendens]|uniref:helix-turn-helix transcriptional regulator n=1 Tax=Candidatus Williamhamiltonella defendens TaxID=138072 RepID=UPI00130E49B9
MKEREIRKLRAADFAFYAEILSELSFKEVKVVFLYCSRYQSNKIALILNISINTVKSHWSNDIQKLNTDHTSELKVLFHFLINHYKGGCSCDCCHCCRFCCCK